MNNKTRYMFTINNIFIVIFIEFFVPFYAVRPFFSYCNQHLDSKIIVNCTMEKAFIIEHFSAI